MRSTIVKRLAVVGAAGAVAAPVSLAAADEPAQQVDLPLAGEAPLVEPVENVIENRLVRRDVRLARKLARVRGEHLRRGYERRLQGWSASHLGREHRRLQRELREARRNARRAAARARTAAAANTTAAPHLEAIAACESGGNPSAIGGGGAYRGKYQFDYGTWASVGGSGDPAAAPEAEQDRRAAILYARAGSSPWPVCG